VYYYAGKSSFGSLYLCRKKLKGVLPDGNMSDKQRIQQIPPTGPRLDMFQIWERPTELRHGAESDQDFQTVIPFFAEFVNYDERLLTSYLAMITQGQISPRSIPWLTDSPQAD
jgi:hypothetical protein